MKTLTRYLLSEMATFWLVSLLTFLGILLTVRMLQLTEMIVNRGVEFSQIFRVFIAIVPGFLEFALPMAALLGVIIAFARLSADSELIVLRASGIALAELVRPVAVFGIALTLLSVVVSMVLRPWGNRLLGDTLFEIAQTRSTAGLRSGVFNKLGPLTLYAEDIDPHTGALERILIDDKRSTSRQIIVAKEGRIQSDPVDRSLGLYLFHGTSHELTNGKYLLTDFDRNRISLDFEQLSAQSGDRETKSRELSLGEILTEMNTTRDRLEAATVAAAVATPTPPPTPSGIAAVINPASPATEEADPKKIQKSLNRLRIELVRKFSMPLACLFLALLAMPLGVQHPRSQRTWGVGLSVMLGLLVFVAYYGALSVFMALGESGKVSPYLGLWLPNLACFALAVWLLKHVCSEHWVSVVQALEEHFGKLKRWRHS